MLALDIIVKVCCVSYHPCGDSVALSRLVPVHDEVIKWKIFRVTGPLWGESTSHRWIDLTKTSFDVFFDMRRNKRLNKQSRSRWFGTPSHSSWRHCNVPPTEHNGDAGLLVKGRADLIWKRSSYWLYLITKAWWRCSNKAICLVLATQQSWRWTEELSRRKNALTSLEIKRNCLAIRIYESAL